jgi:hypothetical protein
MSLKNFFNNLLKRIGAEDFPPVLLAEAALLFGAHWAGRQFGHFLDIAAGERRGIEEHDAGGNRRRCFSRRAALCAA